MTPTEIKAKELVNKNYSLISGMAFDYIANLIVYPKGDSNYETSKQCAIICVEELINDHSQDHTDDKFYYWKEVLTHLKSM